MEAKRVLNLSDMFKQAQGLQAKISELYDRLAEKKAVGTSGGGMVTVEVNGRMEVLSVRIDRDLVGPEDFEMLEELIAAACNEALGRARDMTAEEMRKIGGGINLPGLFQP
jgi:DNA-binding YbaB/EbfC family protein